MKLQRFSGVTMDVKLLLLKTDSLKFKRKRNWNLLLFLYFMLDVKQRRNRTSHKTEQQAYLYSLTNRAKRTVRLVPAICRVESVYVCGFVCVRMCMVCWLLTLGMAVVC